MACLLACICKDLRNGAKQKQAKSELQQNLWEEAHLKLASAKLFHGKNRYTPWKINMGRKNGGLGVGFRVIFIFHVNFPGFIQPSTIRFVFSVRYLGEWQ